MKKLKVVVCSKNAIKVDCVRQAIKSLEINVSISSLQCKSDVSDQPMSEQEAFLGACNRIKFAKALKKADIFIAIESGIRKCEVTDTFVDFSFTVVESATGHRFHSKSAEFVIDPLLMHLVNSGQNLGQASDFVFNTKNIASGIGLSGLKSKNIVPRIFLHFQPTVFALCDYLRSKETPIV